MKKIKNRAAVLTIIFSLSGLMSGAALAATQPQGTSEAHVGLALPLVKNLSDIADPGISIGAKVFHSVDSLDSYGVGVNYFSFGKASKDNVETEVSVISTMLMAHRLLSAQKGVQPFFETGLGFARTQVNINELGKSNPAVLRGTNQEDISPTFLLGLGFDKPILGDAMVGASVEYQHFFFKVGDVNGGGSLTFLAHVRM